MFRVNYGNGQVSETFSSKRAASKYIESVTQYRRLAFIQFRDNGEWFRAR